MNHFKQIMSVTTDPARIVNLMVHILHIVEISKDYNDIKYSKKVYNELKFNLSMKDRFFMNIFNVFQMYVMRKVSV